MATLRCRPSESEREPIKVFMSATQMLSLKLRNGDLCSITWKDQTDTAVAWLTSKADLKDGVVGVSRWLQDRCGIKLENKVVVEKSQSVLQDAATIQVESVQGEIPPSELSVWAFAVKDVLLDNHRYVVPEQKFFAVINKHKKEFEILASTEHSIFKVTESSTITIGTLPRVNGIGAPSGPKFDQIGGLRSQKRLLKRVIGQVIEPELIQGWPEVTQNARGVILWGPPRAGKTMLRKAMESEASWARIYDWRSSMVSPLDSLDGPQLVHVEIVSKLSELDAGTLLRFLRSGSRSTLVVAEIQNPNDMPSFLRNEDTFADEIEITVPDVVARSEILNLITREFGVNMTQRAAAKTHGYVGGDLRRLVIETRFQAAEEFEDVDDQAVPKSVALEERHLDRALSKIRPSALQQVFLEKPNVRWSDIGGQEELKARLRNAVEWPLKYPKEMRLYGMRNKKGILLYGPPGCSKTMLVKALATESDYNFLAVKGAELISMYVGESERATREVFRKARAASPCIVFFDEIDSIAKRASGSSELNVLTTLLNELDGFEELKDVFVVAATNKPEAIDPALLRPGRFDQVVYVGPPDKSTREAIFTEKFKTMLVETECKSVPDEFVSATDRFSGADIVAVCDRAGEIAFARALQQQTSEVDGNEVTHVANGDEKNIAEHFAHGRITCQDVREAIAGTRRSVTDEMLEEYAEWDSRKT